MGLSYEVRLPETKLLPLTLEMVKERYASIDETVLRTWRFYRVKNNIEFSGTTRTCFWAGKGSGNALAIKPPIKKAIKEVLETTEELCKEHNLEPNQYVEEAALLLKGLVETIINEMIKIDRKLRGKGYPEKIQPLPREQARMKFGFSELENYIDGQASSAIFLAKQSMNQRSNVSDVQGSKKKVAKAKKPAGTEPDIKPKAETWKQVTIDFLDNDTVRYKINGEGWVRANYAELGFNDKRKGLPNKLWSIFRGMAEHSSGGYITMRTPRNISKDVDRIRATLRKFFGIKAIPMQYKKIKKAYQVYFNFSYKQDS